MNENRQLENQIDREIRILDRFRHPTVSDDLTAAVVRSMAERYHRTGTFRFILRVVVPMAAAAGLALTAWIFFPADSCPTTQSRGTEITSIWSSEAESQEMETLFADLDFSVLATQPATTQKVDEAVEEMDLYLMDMMNST